MLLPPSLFPLTDYATSIVLSTCKSEQPGDVFSWQAYTIQEGPPRKWPQRGERESQNTERSLTTFRPHRNLRKNASSPSDLTL
jgi:hypothetical protein